MPYYESSSSKDKDERLIKELIIRKEYIDRTSKNIKMHTINKFDEIVSVMSTAKGDKSYMNISDFSSFHIVSSIMHYMMSIYVLLKELRGATQSKEMDDWVGCQIEIWKGYYEKIKRANSFHIDYWIERFIKLYRLEKCAEYLSQQGYEIIL